jgi:hypothetical protein
MIMDMSIERYDCRRKNEGELVSQQEVGKSIALPVLVYTSFNNFEAVKCT